MSPRLYLAFAAVNEHAVPSSNFLDCAGLFASRRPRAFLSSSPQFNHECEAADFSALCRLEHLTCGDDEIVDIWLSLWGATVRLEVDAAHMTVSPRASKCPEDFEKLAL